MNVMAAIRSHISERLRLDVLDLGAEAMRARV
jgi:hypothetical protein